MKSKTTTVALIISLLLSSFSSLLARDESSSVNAFGDDIRTVGTYGLVRLRNGVYVGFATINSDSAYTTANISSTDNDNIVHRVLFDRDRGIYFGYGLKVEPVDKNKRFKVSIRPLSQKFEEELRKKIWPRMCAACPSPKPLASSQLQYSNEPQVIDDGDTLSLDLLVSPTTGAKISDIIKISLNPNNVQLATNEFPTQEFKPENVSLAITSSHKLLVNGKEMTGKGRVVGPLIYFYLPEKGRFILSLVPREGFDFQKAGYVENNVLSFTLNGDKYEWISDSPVVAIGGKWSLWVMRDPNYQIVAANLSPYTFGAAGRVEDLLSNNANASLQKSISKTGAQTSQQTKDDDDVVRITTTLVQLDAVVTKNGKQVTDLKAEDFEVLEDGKPQKITHFSYVPLDSEPVPSSKSNIADKSAPPEPQVPAQPLRPEQVRRSIAIVIDTGMAFTSLSSTRQALKKYVDEQIRQGDLIAIVPTGSGSGALQQFTSDKRALYAAIEKIRWTGRYIDPVLPLDAMTSGVSTPLQTDPTIYGAGRAYTSNAVGGLRYAIQGLKKMPGRKAVVFVSDTSGISEALDQAEVFDSQPWRALSSVTELANRSSVVIYTVDGGGLQPLGLTAADVVGGTASQEGFSGLNRTPIQGDPSFDSHRIAQSVNLALNTRRDNYMRSVAGLRYLGEQTGGLYYGNNDLYGGLKRVVEDQKGYYLIAYTPSDSTFESEKGRRKRHKLQVKVKLSGYDVRSRKSFYGVADEELPPESAPHTRYQQMKAALTSPFASSDVYVRVTPLFINGDKGPYIRSLLHINGRDLSFKDEPDGWRKTTIDLVALTYGADGQIIDEVNTNQEIQLRGQTYEKALQHGLTFNVDVPVKRAGLHHLRVAVRDVVTERVGSAHKFIEIPDLKKERLALSSLIIKGIDDKAEAQTPSRPTAVSPIKQLTDTPEDQLSREFSDSGPSVRRLTPGMNLMYGYEIFNAKLDKATRLPRLMVQMILYKDGKQIYVGDPKAYEVNQQTNLQKLADSGILKTKIELTPGQYILQVVVTDMLAKEKERIATQWIDFEVVE